MDKDEYNRIMALEKFFDKKVDFIKLPTAGEKLELDAYTTDGREKIFLTISSGRLSAYKTSNHARYQDNTGLLRICFNRSAKHTNPDGTIIKGSHLHYFTEDYDLRWAISLDDLVKKGYATEREVSSKEEIFEFFCSKLNIIKEGWHVQMGF